MLQNREGLGAPEKLRNGQAIYAGVLRTEPDFAQTNPSRATIRRQNSPPVRHDLENAVNVARTANDCHVVENTTIHVDLMREAGESVMFTLDFEAAYLAVDHRQVDPRLPLAYTEFIDNAGRGVRTVLA